MTVKEKQNLAPRIALIVVMALIILYAVVALIQGNSKNGERIAETGRGDDTVASTPESPEASPEPSTGETVPSPGDFPTSDTSVSHKDDDRPEIPKNQFVPQERPSPPAEEGFEQGDPNRQLIAGATDPKTGPFSQSDTVKIEVVSQSGERTLVDISPISIEPISRDTLLRSTTVVPVSGADAYVVRFSVSSANVIVPGVFSVLTSDNKSGSPFAKYSFGLDDCSDDLSYIDGGDVEFCRFFYVEQGKKIAKVVYDEPGTPYDYWFATPIKWEVS